MEKQLINFIYGNTCKMPPDLSQEFINKRGFLNNTFHSYLALFVLWEMIFSMMPFMPKYFQIIISLRIMISGRSRYFKSLNVIHSLISDSSRLSGKSLLYKYANAAGSF